MQIIIIAAISRNMAIGKDDLIPWYLPEDLRHFKKVTHGHAVIMGRGTFHSMHCKPLPDRYNLVISRTMPYHEGVQRCRCLRNALTLAEARGHTKAFIIGGEQVYSEALRSADELMLTTVDLIVPNPDAVFPSYERIAACGYAPISRSGMQCSQLGVRYQFEQYERRK